MPTTILVGADEIDPDAVVLERFSWPAEVTQHPVERGVDLADHVRPAPLQVDLEVLFTEHPLTIPTFAANGAQEQPGPALGPDRPIARASAVADRLRRAQVDAEFVSVVSARRGLVANLAVVEVQEIYETPRGVILPISLRQVRVAEVRTVDVPEALQDRGRRGRNRGKQPAAEVPPARRRSLLTSLTGYGQAVE